MCSIKSIYINQLPWLPFLSAYSRTICLGFPSFSNRLNYLFISLYKFPLDFSHFMEIWGGGELAARIWPPARRLLRFSRLEKTKTQAGPYHLHGKTGNFDLKINWFASFRLERSVNYRSPVGEIHILYSFQWIWVSLRKRFKWFEPFPSSANSNLVVKCLRVKFPTRDGSCKWQVPQFAGLAATMRINGGEQVEKSQKAQVRFSLGLARFFTLLSDRLLNSVNLYLIDRLYATSKERYTRGMGGGFWGGGRYTIRSFSRTTGSVLDKNFYGHKTEETIHLVSRQCIQRVLALAH